MFLVVHDPINTSQNLNNDLHKVSLWAYKWKMSFNPDPSKQAQELFFSRKINKIHHPPLLFNNSTIQQISSQKHLGIHLDEELAFKHINEKINKANKGIGIICKCCFINILSFFYEAYFDYGDVIYDQPECISCNNRSYKRNAPRRAIPGIRFGISQKQKMVKAYVLVLQTY